MVSPNVPRPLEADARRECPASNFIKLFYSTQTLEQKIASVRQSVCQTLAYYDRKKFYKIGPWPNCPPAKSMTTRPMRARLEKRPFLSTTETSSCLDSRLEALTPLQVNTSLQTWVRCYKTFLRPQFTNFYNKLEHLSLTSFSSLFLQTLQLST